MDYLKRDLAPITEAAWNEIEEEARNVLSVRLTGRRLVDVSEPHGFGYAAVSSGRLVVPPDQSHDSPSYGIYEVDPLIEVRFSFELDRWELDNIDRGLKSPDLDNLTDACVKMADFEDSVIYEGLDDVNITGLIQEENPPIQADTDIPRLMKYLNMAKNRIMDHGIGGPFTLAINTDRWSDLMAASTGYPLNKRVAEILDEIIVTPAIDDALVVSRRGGDLELTLGMDFAVGYASHTAETVKLFLTESFTFQIFEPKSIQMVKFA